MTDTSGISVLALGVSFVSAIWSIAAVLMARANLQRQIRVAAREAWMREFRKQVAQFLTGIMNSDLSKAGGAMSEAETAAEIASSVTSSATVIRLLIAEHGPHAGFFEHNVNRLVVMATRSDATPEKRFEIADAMNEATNAAMDVLRRERALVEADALWKLPRLGLAGRRPWARFIAWSRRPPPR